MRVVCAFCKTNFKVARSGAGKCPICGHRASVLAAQSGTPKFFITVALFLAVSIFSVVAIKLFNQNQRAQMLTVSISEIRHTDTGYIIRGNIRNFSENTYSVPDMMFIFKTESGVVLNRIVQLPPSTSINPKSDMKFLRRLEPRVHGAQRISVRFVEN